MIFNIVNSGSQCALYLFRLRSRIRNNSSAIGLVSGIE